MSMRMFSQRYVFLVLYTIKIIFINVLTNLIVYVHLRIEIMVL